MRSFLRVSGERRKILLDSNFGVNFTLGSAFQVPSVKAPPPALENPSVTVPADKQSPNFTTDSFTKLDTQAFSLGTTGTFKPMTADEINNANIGWLDSTDAELGDIVQANIPDAYEKVEGENKQAEAQAQQVAKQQQAANAKQTQELFTMIIQLLGMFGGGGMGGMSAIANVASGTTAATNTTSTNSTAPTTTTAPVPTSTVPTPTVVA